MRADDGENLRVWVQRAGPDGQVHRQETLDRRWRRKSQFYSSQFTSPSFFCTKAKKTVEASKDPISCEMSRTSLDAAAANRGLKPSELMLQAPTSAFAGPDGNNCQGWKTLVIPLVSPPGRHDDPLV